MADSRQTKVVLCGYEFEGISISGQETSIIVPKAKVTFDIGRCPQRACFQPTILLSHTHLDHIGGLAFHVCTRRMLELPSSRVVCPVGAGSKVRRVVDVAQEVQNSPPIDFEVLELESGADMSIDIPSTEFIVKSFPTCHPIESQGYVLYSKREKLLPELQGLKGAEIKKRKDAGEKVTQSILVPEIAFTGDTTSAFLDGNSPVLADALRAKVLIMEMTYLGIDFTPEQARDRGHMHVQDFVDREDMFKNEAIMLIHFSPRYKRSEILAQLEAALPPKLAARCTPLLNGIE